MDLETYKTNHKTQYLAEMYEKLLSEEQQVLNMLEKDPSMKELGSEELRKITEQKTDGSC